IEDLHARVHRGAYRALPSRRRYIPKADGQQRPLAVAALEDKIVQGAACAVLNAIYEEDFLGFSYGFRPKRSQHDALDALMFGIYSGARASNIVAVSSIDGSSRTGLPKPVGAACKAAVVAGGNESRNPLANGDPYGLRLCATNGLVSTPFRLFLSKHASRRRRAALLSVSGTHTVD